MLDDYYYDDTDRDTQDFLDDLMALSPEGRRQFGLALKRISDEKTVLSDAPIGDPKP